MGLNDAEIERAIDELLDRCAPGVTIGPSDAARLLADDDAFQPLLDDVHRVAGAMVDRGTLVATLRGEVVDPRTARGPIRLRRP